MIWERGAPLKSSPPLNIFDLEAWHLIYGIMNYIELSWFATCTFAHVGNQLRLLGCPSPQKWPSSPSVIHAWRVSLLVLICQSLQVIDMYPFINLGHTHDPFIEHHSPIYLWVIMAMMSKRFTSPFWVQSLVMLNGLTMLTSDNVHTFALLSWQEIEYKNHFNHTCKSLQVYSSPKKWTSWKFTNLTWIALNF